MSVAGGSCLCTAWPRPDLSEGFLQLDLKCCSPILISHPPTQLILNTGELTPILCPKLKGVKISVVVQSVDFKKHTPPRLVHELVKDMLKGLYVHTKFVINLEDFDTDIRYVVIEDIKLDSARAGLITSKTSVEITSIQTVQHFRSQMQDQFVAPLGGLEGVSILLYLAGAHVQCIFCLPRTFEFFFFSAFQVSASLKEMLQLPLLYPGTLTSLGVMCPRGVLLVGPPGVGKTLLVRKVVAEVGARLVVIRGPEVPNYVNEMLEFLLHYCVEDFTEVFKQK